DVGDIMTKVQIVPVEPTNKMINKAINVPIPLVLLDSISAVQSLKFTTKYKAALDEAPDPTENAELVERVAKWLAVHYKDPPATAATGFYLNSKWPHFVGGAKDLLKCIEGKE